LSDAPVVAPETYARWRGTTIGRVTEQVETELVLRLAGPLHGKRVLDVGTGDGTYAIEAASRGATVSAVDSEAAMLEAARLRASERGLALTLRCGRAEVLPFEDGAFDIVLAVTVLCFVRDAATAVREVARVLAPGGRVVLGELARWSSWALQRRVRGWFGAATWRRAHFWSRRDLVALVAQAQLRVAEVRGAVFFPPSSVAARVFAPIEPILTRVRAPFPAFLAVAADKPESRS